MVAFLLGGELTRENLASNGRAIFSISLSVVIGTTLAIWAGLSAFGLDPRLALLLGAIATATDPAAISEVIRQSGMRNGFTATLKGIVAIDDVWGLLMFSICLALVDQSGGWAAPILGAGRDIGGAILLGLCVGIPSAILTGRLPPRRAAPDRGYWRRPVDRGARDMARRLIPRGGYDGRRVYCELCPTSRPCF
ncbi:Na(+)/H(+) antiporter [Litoreibacter arenae DSM 19593]|uniref:Na(+)/H(+) antiporter n=2 Tax=Litoreibacter TaxID=947567 RepID=S9QBF2_9RHOB|nr:Na(+)/H(+) antiporter [Litoreibacter arenae DSM 19593]